MARFVVIYLSLGCVFDLVSILRFEVFFDVIWWLFVLVCFGFGGCLVTTGWGLLHLVCVLLCGLVCGLFVCFDFGLFLCDCYAILSWVISDWFGACFGLSCLGLGCNVWSFCMRVGVGLCVRLIVYRFACSILFVGYWVVFFLSCCVLGFGFWVLCILVWFDVVLLVVIK